MESYEVVKVSPGGVKEDTIKNVWPQGLPEEAAEGLPAVLGQAFVTWEDPA
jgi:hypothetical protein